LTCMSSSKPRPKRMRRALASARSAPMLDMASYTYIAKQQRGDERGVSDSGKGCDRR
jgi:hypothetical protein